MEMMAIPVTINKIEKALYTSMALSIGSSKRFHHRKLRNVLKRKTKIGRVPAIAVTNETGPA